MHEVSIVNSVIKTLEQTFSAEKLDDMTVIHLKVGLLSNIEPRLLVNAFEAVRMNTRYENIKLNIATTPIVIKCETCNHNTEVKNYKFICEKCNKPSKNLIQGEEMLIHKVEFNN